MEKRLLRVILTTVFLSGIFWQINGSAMAFSETSPYTEITISAAGDCTLGTDANFSYAGSLPAKYDEVKNPAYFFEGVAPIFANDDLTMVNMEGTLTTNGTRADKTYAFRGDPVYTEILTSGSIEVCNLANNHSRDYGEVSYTDTITHIENAGIKTFGLGRTSVFESKGLKIGLAGVYELPYGINCKDTLIKDINSLKDEGVNLIVVNFHWGIEREYYPEDIQVSLAHSAIDNGADLVIGHHPHVLQGIEKYRGKYIAYSLGNFCFGGNKNPADKDTAIFTQTFSFEGNELVNPKVSRGIFGEINMLNSDNSFTDTLRTDGVNIVPCRISSRTNVNDYQPTILTGEEADRVIQKIEDLSTPF